MDGLRENHEMKSRYRGWIWLAPAAWIAAAVAAQSAPLVAIGIGLVAGFSLSGSI